MEYQESNQEKSNPKTEHQEIYENRTTTRTFGKSKDIIGLICIFGLTV
jgi:hypothetical protein